MIICVCLERQVGKKIFMSSHILFCLFMLNYKSHLFGGMWTKLIIILVLVTLECHTVYLLIFMYCFLKIKQVTKQL